MRTFLELVKELHYNLRIIVVPIDGPAIFFEENKSVLNGASIPESKLSRKHMGICYYAVRESYSSGICKVGFVNGTQNVANCLIKILSGYSKEMEVEKCLWRK